MHFRVIFKLANGEVAQVDARCDEMPRYDELIRQKIGE